MPFHNPFIKDGRITFPEGASLVSSLSAALLSCPEVDELFCDDLELRDRITDLG